MLAIDRIDRSILFFFFFFLGGGGGGGGGVHASLSERSSMYEDTPIPQSLSGKLTHLFLMKENCVESPPPKKKKKKKKEKKKEKKRLYQGWVGITACIQL